MRNKSKHWKHWGLQLGLLAALGLFAAARPAHAQAVTSTDSTSIPLTLTAFVPCANGGAGEFVSLSGTLHILTHETTDDTGGIHFKMLVNPQDVSGVGLTTGDKYQGTGGTQSEVNLTVGEEMTFINNFRIIGQGPDNNFLVHDNLHVTINANGEVTASVDNFSVECK